MSNPNCIFCKIIKKEIPAEIIYENADFISFVDINPNNFGHCLLLPKAHFKNIYDLSDDILKKFGKEIQKLSVAIKMGTEADGINAHMNNESAAGQVVPHAHIHIIPRFLNDGLKHFQQKKYESSEQIKEIGTKIRSAL
jgi:histidine triad (HIT) family protein